MTASRSQKQEMSQEEALRLVAWALRGVRYGEIIVKMQAGKPVSVDKYARERVGIGCEQIPTHSKN